MAGISRCPSQLQTFRHSQRMSQAQLAEKVGVSTVTINRWENGFVHPRPYCMRKLCQLFRTSEQELFPATSNRQCEAGTSEKKELLEEEARVSILKNLRLKCSLTQEELAKAIGATRLSIHRWECGKTKPSMFFIQQLCIFFQMEASELFPGAFPIEEPFLDQDRSPSAVSEIVSPPKENVPEPVLQEKKQHEKLEEKQEGSQENMNWNQNQRGFFLFFKKLLSHK